MARRSVSKDNNQALLAVGVGLAATAAGAFMLRKAFGHSADTDDVPIDAPHYVLDKPSARTLVGQTLLIGRPRQLLFDAWQPARFAEFMEDVVSARKVGADRWEMEIKAPVGESVTLVNRITEVVPGREISWQSDDSSDIANSGKVSFADAPAKRGTYVTLVVAYQPPGGAVGRALAWLFRREPAIQARRNLRRFKQLMETGEVTSNASPSARASESPAEPHS